MEITGGMNNLGDRSILLHTPFFLNKNSIPLVNPVTALSLALSNLGRFIFTSATDEMFSHTIESHAVHEIPSIPRLSKSCKAMW